MQAKTVKKNLAVGSGDWIQNRMWQDHRGAATLTPDSVETLSWEHIRVKQLYQFLHVKIDMAPRQQAKSSQFLLKC